MAEPDRPSSSSPTKSAGPSKATGDALHTVDKSPPAESSMGTIFLVPAQNYVNDLAAGIYYPKSKQEWLSSTYLCTDAAGALTLRHFSKIKASTHEADAYWEDAHINWALEMIRRRHEGLNDVYIVPPYECRTLYNIGDVPGWLPDRSSAIGNSDWETNYAPVAEKMRHRNFVILPVNNAYTRKNQSEIIEGSRSNGAHWSFIVVDRRDPEKPSAYYVDGMVQAVRRQNGKWRIDGIQFNGAIAGKVLCGFENLLGLEKGRFAAQTMKFVPHMYKDNALRVRDNDEGSCGPHLYAFMDHILTNKTTLMDPGMGSIYNDAATKRFRATEFGFNSIASRDKLAEELMQERRRQEAAQPANYVDNLTPHVLRSLMTVVSLISLVRGTVRSVASGHEGDDHDDEDGTFGDDPAMPTSFLREVIQSNPGLYRDIPKRADRYRRAYNFLKGKQQARESKNGSTDSGEKAQKPKKKDTAATADVYVGRIHYRNIPCDNQTIFPPHEPPAKFPGSFRHMPFHDLSTYGVTVWINANPDIKAQINTRGKKKVWIWTASAMLHLKFKKTFLSQPDDEFEQAWSRDEQVFSPDELKALKEKHKGEENKRMLYGIMRERVMRHYQGDKNVDDLLKRLEKYKVKEPSAGTKRKRSDDDGSGSNADSESDDDGDKGDSTRPGSKKGKTDDAAAGTSGAPVITTGSATDAAEDATAVTTSNSASLTTPRPAGLLNFRVMNPDELETYMTDEMRNDPRYRNVLLKGERVEPNDVSTRAMCFVDIAEEQFGGESDADCFNVWYNDSLVFTEIQRRTAKCSPGFIRKQMDQHYHLEGLVEEDGRVEEQDGDETEEDTDKDEDDDEEHDAGEGLHDLSGGEEETNDVADPLAPSSPVDRPASPPHSPAETSSANGTKRKREASESSVTKRPKLYCPDFLHMKDWEIARWIDSMPPPFRNEFPAYGQTLEPTQIRRARIWLERMHGEGFEHMRTELALSEMTSEEGKRLSETDVMIKKHTLLSEADKKKLRLWRVTLWNSNLNSPVGSQDFLHNILLRDPVVKGRKVLIPDLTAELDGTSVEAEM